MREERGCDAPSIVAQFTFDGEELKRCPLRIVTREAVEATKAHGYVQAGLLPEPGGVLDQPAVFLRAMEFVSGLMAKAVEEETKWTTKQR